MSRELLRRALAEAVGTGFLVAAVVLIAAQVAGGVLGAIAANLMFELDAVAIAAAYWFTSSTYPGKRYEDWELTDPARQPIEVVREVRDAIRDRVQRLGDELLTEGSSDAGRQS